MAITLVQRKKIQQGLILMLVVVLLITAAVLWLGVFKKGGMGAASPDVAVPEFQPIEINFGVLQNPVLEELDNPPAPVGEPESVGRSNPFLPF